MRLLKLALGNLICFSHKTAIAMDCSQFQKLVYRLDEVVFEQFVDLSNNLLT